MKNDTQLLLKDLIAEGKYDFLHQIRDGYTRELPLEKIHPEDRETCEAIDHFFKAKTEIESLIKEKATHLDGTHTIKGEHDIYDYVALVKVSHLVSVGCELTPRIDDANIEILDLFITI
jgi:hypothetical protein